MQFCFVLLMENNYWHFSAEIIKIIMAHLKDSQLRFHFFYAMSFHNIADHDFQHNSFYLIFVNSHDFFGNIMEWFPVVFMILNLVFLLD